MSDKDKDIELLRVCRFLLPLVFMEALLLVFVILYVIIGLFTGGFFNG